MRVSNNVVKIGELTIDRDEYKIVLSGEGIGVTEKRV